MIENNEFPEEIPSDDIQDFVYQSSAVHNWFQRCIEDFPKYPVLGKGEPWTHKEYEAWFDKWFGQFRNKGDI